MLIQDVHRHGLDGWFVGIGVVAGEAILGDAHAVERTSETRIGESGGIVPCAHPIRDRAAAAWAAALTDPRKVELQHIESSPKERQLPACLFESVPQQ